MVYVPRHEGPMNSICRLSDLPALIGTLAMCLLPVGRAGGQEKEIALATQGNNAALDRLSQIAFLATIEEGEGAQSLTYKVEYWRSGERWRMKVKGKRFGPPGSATYDIDVCSTGSELRSVAIRRGAANKTTCLLREARPFPSLETYNVWDAGLLTVHTSRKTLTLAEMLAHHEVVKVEREGSGPEADLVFHVKVDGQPAGFWVSPRYNFLVRKTSSNPAGDERSQIEVLNYQEVEPGVFFPSRVEGGWIQQGSWTRIRTIKFTNVVLNRPHPPETFALKYPRGALLFNEPRNQNYVTDEDGKPLGKVTTLPELPLTSTSLPDKGVEPLTETKEEPQSWTGYILYASLGILTVAGVIWLFRRRFQSSD